MAENKAWTEVATAAAGFLCWSKLVCVADEPAIARCEIEALRYATLHIAGKVTLSAPQVRLHLDGTWAWAKALERAFVLPPPGRFCHLSAALCERLVTTTNGRGSLLHALEQLHLPLRQRGGAHGRAAPGRQRCFGHGWPQHPCASVSFNCQTHAGVVIWKTEA
jgi:hypothetical protein